MLLDGIWDGVATVVCDLDGVVYVGDECIPGAGAALAAIEGAGLQLLFVTNNSTGTAVEVAAKIERTCGFFVPAESVATSAIVTAAHMAGTVRSAFVVGAPSIDAALRDREIAVTTDWTEADAVVVGLDRDLSYEKLSSAVLAIRAGAAFYATNLDPTYPTPRGLLPGGGAVVSAVQTAADAAPIVAGKPHQPMVDHIARLTPRGEVLVVGDRPATDVALAQHGGWRSALVLTGVVSSLQEVPASLVPDVVVGSLPELVGLMDD